MRNLGPRRRLGAAVLTGAPMFALVDCNNFYASCERVFNPAIRTRPVVVLSNNDGCVIARSNEAKALGFKMGDPYFKVRPQLERHGVAVFSSNYTLYGDISQPRRAHARAARPDRGSLFHRRSVPGI